MGIELFILFPDPDANIIPAKLLFIFFLHIYKILLTEYERKKALNQLISLLPMPAVVIDNKGIIEEANLVFKEKFNFNRISKKK